MALVSRGLLARYFLDEAPGGQGSTKVFDRSGVGVPFDLTITYDGTNLNWAQLGGSRALDCTNIAGDQNAEGAIDDSSDKIRDALVGTKEATLVVVAAVREGNSGGGRLFAINPESAANTILGFNSNAATTLQAVWEGTVMRTWSTGTGVNVWTIVYNTAEGTADDRVKIYKNGILFAATVIANPTLDNVLAIAASSFIYMFNRGAFGFRERSVDATLFYAALHSIAATPDEILSEAFDLLKRSDRPIVRGIWSRRLWMAAAPPVDVAAQNKRRSVFSPLPLLVLPPVPDGVID
jgi:hypothetical protein